MAPLCQNVFIRFLCLIDCLIPKMLAYLDLVLQTKTDFYFYFLFFLLLFSSFFFWYPTKIFYKKKLLCFYYVLTSSGIPKSVRFLSRGMVFIMKMHPASSYPNLQLVVMTHCMTDAWTHGSSDLSLPSLKLDHIIIFKSSGVSNTFTNLIETQRLIWLHKRRTENQCIPLLGCTVNRDCEILIMKSIIKCKDICKEGLGRFLVLPVRSSVEAYSGLIL